VQTAVRLGPSDDLIEVLFEPCEGELVRNVRLVELVGVVVGGEEDPVLWEIVAPEGSEESRFMLGEAPEGFDERVPLQGIPSPETELATIIQTTRDNDNFVEFRIRDLRRDQVLWRSALVSVEEFQREAAERCA
jgi:hypothetical protein